MKSLVLETLFTCFKTEISNFVCLDKDRIIVELANGTKTEIKIKKAV